MHLRCKYLVLFMLAGFVNAYKQCPMPGGNEGECRPLKQCKPLQELNEKRVKTKSELLYISQSKCGIMADFQIMVCCPPEPLWSKSIIFKPVILKEKINYETLLKEKDDDTSDKIIEPTVNAINKNFVVLGEHESSSINLSRNYTNRNTEQSETKIETRSSILKFGCGQQNSYQNRIKGGTATEIDQYPWLVLLEYNSKKKFCVGSLITTRYVLTAAHCIKRQTKPRFARLAEYNTTSGPTDFVNGENITVERVPIAKNIAHPNFTYAQLHHDIGLSKLSKDAVLSEFIRLICLPDQDLAKSFQEPTGFIIAGWGSDGIKFSDVKKSVMIPFVALHKCRPFHESYDILDSQICAGGNLGEDSCKGDSGGPLMYERNNIFVVVGIVSYGKEICGLENVPGVYTYVYPYLDWLRENMI